MKIEIEDFEEKLMDLYMNPWKLSMKRCKGKILFGRCRYPRYGNDDYCYYHKKKHEGLFG